MGWEKKSSRSKVMRKTILFTHLFTHLFIIKLNYYGTYKRKCRKNFRIKKSN